MTRNHIMGGVIGVWIRVVQRERLGAGVRQGGAPP